MIKFLSIFLLIFLKAIQAAFVFGDGDLLNPMPEYSQKLYLSYAGKLHLLPQCDAEKLFQDQLKEGCYGSSLSHYRNLKMTQIPQTTWDLFMLLEHLKKAYKMEGVPYSDVLSEIYSEPIMGSYVSAALNNQFIRLVCDGGLRDAFEQRKFVLITDYFINCIQRHLVDFYRILKEDTVMGEDSLMRRFDQMDLIFLFLDLFPEVKTFLRRATEIEEDCLARDMLALWRHANTLESAPLAYDMNGVKFKTRSFGYSILACSILDGTFASIASYAGNCSACIFTYFAQIQRDHVYATMEEGSFPYSIYAQEYEKKERIREKLNRMMNNVTCVILPKIAIGLDQIDLNMWYFPKTFSNHFIKLTGEISHPRLRGNDLNCSENEYRKLFLIRKETEELMREFMKLHVVWVAFKGKVFTENNSVVIELEEKRLAELEKEQSAVSTKKS
ncbi:MAG: hypothetical protein HEEMFOPI_00045 [Holosporales bacterium]